MATKTQYLSYLQLPQVKAALDTIAWAEGGISYNTLFGGGSFSGSQHPNQAITAGGYTSTAAGRYQFLYRTWIEIKNRLGLADFSAQNQDIAALDLINQRGQLGKLTSGDFEGMLRGLGCAWAALPFSGCGQRERDIGSTLNYYNGALRVYGGTQTANPGGSNQPSQSLGIGGQTAIYLLGAVLLYLVISNDG